MFAHHFIVRGKDLTGHARSLISGLLGKAKRKNIERIESDVAESDYEGMQHFISNSPWNHSALMDQVATETDASLGRHRDTCLIFDEASHPKKGEDSVGVQRQYCGRLGKTENCQVGVYACMGRGRHAAIIDFRLFLPESWALDDARCAKAKVPEEQRVHRTKTELALEMVHAARARGSSHRWIGGDEVYGNNQEFCAQLEDLGETFLMDVAHNTKVWATHPQPRVPEAEPSAPRRGRKLSKPRASNTHASSRTIKDLVDEHFVKESRMLSIRETTQGKLLARIWVKEVWLWDGGSGPVRRRLLVVRQEGDGTFKYSLSNAATITSWERLAYWQAQRFWIEQSFKEAKSELGMGHYEVRGWPGWHHHMALVCLAQLFTVRERLAVVDSVPLLSVRDIIELLDLYLPRRERTEAEVFRQMQERHRKRTQAKKAHAKRQRKLRT
jgi:SRSO17 transposase